MFGRSSVAPFGVEKFRRLVFVGSFSVVTEFLMGFLGSVFSGHLLGEEALAGVSLLSPVFTTVIFVSGLFGVGMGVNYALEMGRCEKQRAYEIFTQGAWSVFGAGSLMLLFFLVGREAYLSFMSPSAAVAAHARDYWRWFAPVAILEPCVVMLVNCCYADGDDRQCYVAYVAQLSVNIIVSFAALKTGWGTAGCALGSLSGYAVAAVILSLHFFKPANSFRFVRHFRLADTFRIVKSSFGDSSGFLCDSLLFFLLGKAFLLQFGSDMLPVLSVVLVTLGLLEIYNGVGVAVQPIVTVYVGERNTLAARQVMRDAIRVSFLEGLVSTALLLVWPGFAVAVVGLDDPALVAASCKAVRLISVGFIFTAIANLLNGYYILVGHEALAVGFTFWMWFFLPAVSIVLFAGLGSDALWTSLGLSHALALILFFIFLAYRYGRDRCPFLLDRSREAKLHIFDLLLEEKGIVDTAHAVGRVFRSSGADASKVMRAELMTEEVLMAVRDRNAGRTVHAEVTLDLNDLPTLTLRDDGEIFDITDTDQRVRSLRTFLVASVMERQPSRMNLITTGFNRNVFRF